MCFFASELEKFALKIAKLPHKTVTDEVGDRYSRRLLLQRRLKPGCGFASNTAPLTEHNADHDLKQRNRGWRQPSPALFLPLDLTDTSVNKQFDTVHEAGVLGGKEDRCLGDLIRLADTAHRNERRQVIEETLLLNRIGADEFDQPGRLDRAGAKGIDTDTAAFQVENPVAGKGANCRFRRRIDTERFGSATRRSRTREDHG